MWQRLTPERGPAEQWFLTGSDLAAPGTLAMSGDIFDCHNLQLVGDATKHPSLNRMTLKTKNYLVKKSIALLFLRHLRLMWFTML